MEKKEEDLQLKLKVLELAVNEFITSVGFNYNVEEMYDRARELYDEGEKQNILGWTSPWSKKPEAVKPLEHVTPVKEEEVKPSPVQGYDIKICPGCGDEIPAGWTEHRYKKDLSKCGYKFK